MNNQKTTNLIGLVIGLILTAILLPIAINQFATTSIRKTEITSLNSVDRASFLLNGSDIGLYNGSTLQPSFTNYTDIILNTTTIRSDNFSVRFIVICSNASAVNLSVIQVIMNSGSPSDFNASFSNFTFNTNFATDVDIPSGVVELKVRLYGVISENVTISTSASLLQYYTDDTTDTLNVIYAVIPIIAVIGVVMLFVKYKNDM